MCGGCRKNAETLGNFGLVKKKLSLQAKRDYDGSGLRAVQKRGPLADARGSEGKAKESVLCL